MAGNLSKLWLFSANDQDVFHYYFNTIDLTDAWSAKFFYFLNFKRTLHKYEKKCLRYSMGIIWMRGLTGRPVSHVIWKDLVLPGGVLNKEKQSQVRLKTPSHFTECYSHSYRLIRSLTFIQSPGLNHFP